MEMVWAVLLLVFVLMRPASAHPSVMPSATVDVQPDGSYKLKLAFDVLAFVLNARLEDVVDAQMEELLDGPDANLTVRLLEAEARFKSTFHVTGESRTGTLEAVSFPTASDIRHHESIKLFNRLPVMLDLVVRGRLPAGARSVSFQFPADMGVVSLSVTRPDQEIALVFVEPGQISAPIPVKLAAGASDSLPDAVEIAEPSRWKWAKRYVELGFVHIIPRGLDHILFVLGLFLLDQRLRPLLMQVSAFTLAHSITLALSIYGVFSISTGIVEPLIAASIVFIAVENILTSRLHRWRLFVVFGFGLIHGLGFAGVLTDLGLPRREFATALVSFNVGVEFGQLTVIGLACLAIGYWRKRDWYRRAIVIPASLAIAATGFFWAIQRTLSSLS